MAAESASDLYAILEVAPDASAGEIKKSYRRLARRWHPDAAEEADRELADERMKLVNSAWAILGDSRLRARYDEERRFVPETASRLADEYAAATTAVWRERRAAWDKVVDRYQAQVIQDRRDRVAQSRSRSMPAGVLVTVRAGAEHLERLREEWAERAKALRVEVKDVTNTFAKHPKPGKARLFVTGEVAAVRSFLDWLEVRLDEEPGHWFHGPKLSFFWPQI